MLSNVQLAAARGKNAEGWINKPSYLILGFAVLFAVFFLGPVFLKQPFFAYPLMSYGDIFDVLTPLVLIPAYWLLFRSVSDERPGFRKMVFFIVFAALWVEGHGIHLAGNSIGHFLSGMEDSDLYRLAYLYDEIIGHSLWHLGVVGLAGLTIYRQWNHPVMVEPALRWLPVAAGIIHGFTFFLITVEGQTTFIGAPFAAAMTLMGILWGRKRFGVQPLTLFFFVAFVTAMVFYVIWRIYTGGLPEFSEWGII